MGPKEESGVRQLFGPWVYIGTEPPYKPRWRAIEVLMFASSGITVGLTIANLLHALLGERRGSLGITICTVVVAALQVAWFVSEHRRMKIMYEHIQSSSKRVEEMAQDAAQEAADGPRIVR